MKDGSVIVDVAVDQGGCVETIKPTTHDNPTYVIEGVVHYGVANMPGAVPRTSTYALTNATLPWVKRLARLGAQKAVQEDAYLRTALNAWKGTITHAGVAEAFGLKLQPAAALV
jgi:alanine dehydrogenase